MERVDFIIIHNHRRLNPYRPYTSLLKCLNDCEAGEEVMVKSVNIGHRQRIRLANLGLFPGVKIRKVKSAPFRGPVEIIVRGSSLVIGRGIASRIMVQYDHTCETQPNRFRKRSFLRA